ncbi:MAG: plasmid maintenance system antidote protein [Bacteroidota bacterium]
MAAFAKDSKYWVWAGRRCERASFALIPLCSVHQDKYAHNCVNKNVYICMMKTELSIVKGIHPGYILERELKKRHLQKGPFAISLNEYPQTLVSITKGKRRMNTNLALKIENALEIEEGYFMTLQLHFDIAEIKRRQPGSRPDLTKLRRILFWDTRMENIDWDKQKKSIIKRVFERGNEIEKMEIIRFYGQESVDHILDSHGK